MLFYCRSATLWLFKRAKSDSYYLKWFKNILYNSAYSTKAVNDLMFCKMEIIINKHDEAIVWDSFYPS